MLISPDWALNAAHVIEGSDFLGGGVSNVTFTLSSGADSFVCTAMERFLHPGWSVTEGEYLASHGIGSVRLSSSVIAFQDGTYGTKRAGENIIDAQGDGCLHFLRRPFRRLRPAGRGCGNHPRRERAAGVGIPLRIGRQRKLILRHRGCENLPARYHVLRLGLYRRQPGSWLGFTAVPAFQTWMQATTTVPERRTWALRGGAELLVHLPRCCSA